MKHTLLTLAAALLISSAVLGQDKGKANKQQPVKKEVKTAAAACKPATAGSKKACCMQPANTARLRAAAVKRTRQPAAAPKKPAGK